MDIIWVEFEKNLIIVKDNQTVKVTPFLTLEHGNVKFGVDAPRSLSVNREEIFHKKKIQETALDE